MHGLQAVIVPTFALALVISGCGDSTPTAPSAPTSVQPVSAAALDAGSGMAPVGRGATNGLRVLAGGAPDLAAADGVTLKATPPVPVSPLADEVTQDLRVTLVTANAVAVYQEYLDVDVVPFTYRFELSRGEMTPFHNGVVEQGVDTTSYSVPSRLENDVRYTWRARAEYEYEGTRHAGPWSEYATFRTPVATIAPPVPTGLADGAMDVWPVVLRVTNGETSGRVGRVAMTFEVATDPAFHNIVTTVERVAGSGSTSVELSADGLEPETTYHWRVIARDDMGTASDYSAARSFTTSRVTIDPPIPTDPANGATGVRPPIVLQVTNGTTRGPVGLVTMTFELATDVEFSALVDTVDQPAGEHNVAGTGRTRQGGSDRLNRTSVQPSVELAAETTYFWRVIARDDRDRASEYSTISQFTTAESGGGGGGGGADEIDVAEVTWLHTDVGGWSATSTITDVRIRDVPAGGICIDHTKARVWPGTRTQGGSNLAGNPWVFGNVGGRWYAATYEWLRPGQICKLTVAGGHQRPSEELGPHIKKPPLHNWRPRSGEQVGFMVSTPARFGPEGPIRERSNIVVVTWP